MRVEIRNRCSDFRSYRAARVKSLFNVEAGCNFDLTADLPIDDAGWKLGLVVGPSGSGKTSAADRPEALTHAAAPRENAKVPQPAGAAPPAHE
jgi:hypothetical protein